MTEGRGGELDTFAAARRELGLELARRRRAVGLSQAALAPFTLYGRSTVANVEVGRQHVGRDFWERCDEAVGAGGALVAEYERMMSQRAVTTPRADDLPRFSGAVTVTVVEMLRQVTEAHRELQRTVGGQGCRESALAYLTWAETLMTRDAASPAVREELLRVVADLFNLVGWVHHDVGQDVAAASFFVRACGLGAEASEPSAVAASYYFLGRIRMHHGQSEVAHRFFGLGEQAALAGGHPAWLGVLHLNQAWAEASLGHAEPVGRHLRAAAAVVGALDPGGVPPAARFVVLPGDLDGMSALVRTTLAGHEEHRRTVPEALELAERAIAVRRGAPEVRSYTFDLISSATGLLLDGEPSAAAVRARQALDSAASVGSTRVIDRLRAWATLAEGIGGAAAEESAEVRERIGGLSLA